MRRKDREVLDKTEIKNLLDKTRILRMSLFDGDYPYIVPMHYGYELLDDKMVFYMHCSKEGHKLELIKNNSHACIELDNDINLISGDDIPCMYGSTFSSIISKGNIEILNDVNEKIHGLKVLMKHQTNRDFNFDEKMATSVEVIRFISNEYSCKMHK